MKPLIAVAGRHVHRSTVLTERGDAMVSDRYIHALHRGGAREAILMPVEIGPEDAREILAPFDGLLLTGGGDISPTRFGAPSHPHVYGVREDRDAFDLALALAAVETGIPTLAICRGMQVLNVALGGTLDPHLPDREDLGPHGRFDGTDPPVAHPVRLEPGSRTAEAAGTEELDSFSSHHQAVEKLGEGLAAVGWSPDGLVEAVELERGWVIGVQWHPETSAHADPANQRLFDTLARRAARDRP